MSEDFRRSDQSDIDPKIAAAAPFKQFMAGRSRKIIAEMRRAGMHFAAPPEGQPDLYDRLNLQLPRAANTVFPFFLDTAPATPARNGSLIFPCPGPEAECDWCVFVINNSHTRPKYDFRCLIKATPVNHAFLTLAYETIFRGPLDESGTAYASQLDSGQISRHALLIALLNSDMFLQQRVKLLVIPVRASWQELAASVSDSPVPPGMG